jgi:hypothetical protein
MTGVIEDLAHLPQSHAAAVTDMPRNAKVFEKKFARTGAGVFDVVDAVVPDGVQDERERLIHLGPIIVL